MIIYLYIKQHSITKLKYFGRTIKNPWKYNGSGTYWTQHIKKHGVEFVETIAVFEFETQDDCSRFALDFSNKNRIVESTEWANLVLEDGMARYTGKSSEKHSTTMIEKWKDSSYRNKQHQSKIDYWTNENFKTMMRVNRKNKWQDAEYREKTVANNKKSRTDDYRVRHRTTMTELWKDPVFKEAQLAKRRKGLYYINNGKVERKISTDDDMPDGFVKGRLKRTKTKSN